MEQHRTFLNTASTLFALSALFTGAVLHAAPGDLDLSFAGTGKARLVFPTADDGNAIAAQVDGKIIVAGSSKNSTDFDFSVARYNPDGSLDSSFGFDGKVKTAIGSFDDGAAAVKVQSDGKIVVAGYSRGGGSRIAVVRYNPGGSLDPTFDGDGIVTTSVEVEDEATALAIQADGKIVVVGDADNFGPGASDNLSAVVRYNADGSLDASFGGGDGIVVSGVDLFRAVTIQADGKIVVAGVSGNGFGAILVVARYHTDGSPDTSFNGGSLSTSLGGRYSSGATGVAIQQGNDLSGTPDKIVVAGSSDREVAVVRLNLNGSFDTSFGGGDGIVFTDLDGGIGVAVATQGVVNQPRKIIVAVSDGSDFTAVRYQADGSLDSSFNGDGIATTPAGTGDNYAYAMAISFGKIVVAGTTRSTSNSDVRDFALVRYNSDGSLDTSFDGDGKRTDNIGSLNSTAQSAAALADGKIISGGSLHNGANLDFLVARHNADGSLDASFGAGGAVITTIGSGDDEGQAVAVQPDGKFVVVGSSSNGSNDDFAVVRYHPNGTLDSSFDLDGKVTTAFGTGDENAQAVVIQPDGKIVVTGSVHNGSNLDFGLARYNPDGSLDASFSFDGKLATGIGSGDDICHAVALAGGKIVVAGGASGDFGVARYQSDGSLDISFHSDGIAATSLGAGNDVAHAIAVQANGRIIVVGSSFNGTNDDLALVRYQSNGSLDPTFDGDGAVTTAIGAGNDTGAAAVLQPNGQIVVAGSSLGGGNSDFALVRYNTNGSLDNSYGNSGKVVVNVGAGGEDSGHAIALDAIGRAVVAGDAAGSSGVVRILGDPFVKISSISVSNGSKITFQGLGVPGEPNSIESSPDLSAGSFTFLTSATPDASGFWEKEIVPAGDRQFYRLASP